MQGARFISFSHPKGFTVIDETQADETEQIVVNIPCRLAQRAQKYANEHGNSITGVVIEALDALLGGRTTDGFNHRSG
jgi:hypothetical protein